MNLVYWYNGTTLHLGDAQDVKCVPRVGDFVRFSSDVCLQVMRVIFRHDMQSAIVHLGAYEGLESVLRQKLNLP